MQYTLGSGSERWKDEEKDLLYNGATLATFCRSVGVCKDGRKTYGRIRGNLNESCRFSLEYSDENIRKQGRNLQMCICRVHIGEIESPPCRCLTCRVGAADRGDDW